MRSAPADPDSAARPAGRTIRAALRCLLAGLSLALLVSCSDTSIPPPSAGATDTSARELGAQRAVQAFGAALQDGDAAAASRLGLAGARSVLAAAVTNVGTLGITDLSVRYVDDQAVLSPAESNAYGPDTWAGTVEVDYRLRDWDQRVTQLETTFVFAPGEHGQLIAHIGGGENRTPLWLDGPVRALQSGRALVISRDTGGARDLKLARAALVAVGKVLPRWRGRLVIEAPATEQELDQALAVTQDHYANIAAVTTTPDGSLIPGTPVHVFLNPRVFDALGPRGAQVVISHESTHVATSAPFASMPTWLLEGFADYVALAHAGIPVSTAASQILGRIRKDGPPDHLPTTADLDPTAPGLGATYEEAWLTTRFIARSFGEPRLVAFYDAVDRGTPVGTAFRQVLGVTEAAFVSRWRVDLRNLAGGMAG